MIDNNITAANLAEIPKRTLPVPCAVSKPPGGEWNSQVGYLLAFALDELIPRHPRHLQRK